MQMIFGQTVVNYYALIVVLCCGIIIIFSSRKYALSAFVLAGTLITLQQRILISSFDFTMLRILISFSALRIIFKHEYAGTKLNKLDKYLLAYSVLRIITYTFLFKTTGAFVNRAGGTYDLLGIYFTTRFLLKSREDMVVLLKSMVYLNIALAILMSIEFTYGKNFLHVLGGVPEYTFVRDGRLRCQGPFQHPITAGTFGAATLMIGFGLLRYNNWKKVIFYFGVLSSIIVVATSNSSGPVLSFAFGVCALFFWRFRHHMTAVQYIIIGTIVFLHLVMKGPVWALIGRVSVFGASTGWHRVMLINNFVNRFKEWWLFGTQSTDHWAEGAWDVTNHFIRVGVDGGIITLIVFLMIIVISFKYIGYSLINEKESEAYKYLNWCMGSALFVHCTAFMSVSYFDQIIVPFYSTIGIIAFLYNFYHKNYVK